MRILFFAGLLAAASPTLAHDDAGHPHRHHDGDHHHGDHTNTSFMTTRDSGVVLPPPQTDDDVFHFVVYGDRTGGLPEGIEVLKQAVTDTNLLDPDLVMTVGDLVQGYNETPEWLDQMREYKATMDALNMKWYPVAGNHDVYWRGEGPAPAGQHESDYEKHFGPLWYSFRHKNAGFIVLYSDEGDPVTNTKAFNVAALQNMSDRQLEFLDKALTDLKDADHVFLFLHHPRWIGGGYEGSNWPVVEQKLTDAGNVSAVFAGHVHHMRYDTTQSGIEYYTLATTGGHLSGDIPDAGYLHHLNMVTVREDRITVAALAVGAVIDPKQFTPEFLAEVDTARKIRPQQKSSPLTIDADGSCQGDVSIEIANPTEFPVAVTLMDDAATKSSFWISTLDHQHFEIAAGETKTVNYTMHRSGTAGPIRDVPAMRLEVEAITSTARVRLPEVVTALKVVPGQVPADYFKDPQDHCLIVTKESDAIRVDAKDVRMPDGPMTIEAWFSPTETAGNRGMIAKTETSEYALFSDEGAPQFSIYLDGRYVVAESKQPMKIGEWTHVAGVYDGTTVSLFVDGKLIDRNEIRRKKVDGQPQMVVQKRNNFPLYIGADPNNRGVASRSFLGKIDEFRLSTAARYAETFEPAKRHQPDPDTLLLFHLDRAIGPFVLNHGDHAATATFGSTGRLVPANR